MKIFARSAICVLLFAGAIIVRAEDTPATRAAFLKLIDRPRVDPAVEIGEAKEEDGLKYTPFSYLSEADERVPGIAVHLATPLSAKLPVVIVMHGTSSNKESALSDLKTLANRGALAIAIDARYHGGRAKGQPGIEAYTDAILKRFKGEQKSFPFYWDTVWDAMRLIDILSAREDVDAERIGVMGYSKGGIETYFLAFADPRIAIAVPCIGVQSFTWGLDNDAWKKRVYTVKAAFEGAAKSAGVEKPDPAFARTFFDKVVPGIYGELDGPAILPLIAPRPLLVINGDTDANTPLPGVLIAAQKAKAAYEKAGAAEKFKLIVQEKTGHTVNAPVKQEAFDWLAKWLKF